MKRIALLLAFVLLATAAHAEKVVGKYIMAGEEMELEAGVNDKGELVAFIRVLGEYDGDKVMMSVTGEANINLFIKKLQYCKTKFIEWKRVAQQNNVVDFTKFYDVAFPDVELWWMGYSDWYSAFKGDYMKPFFRVSAEGETAFVAGGTVEDWRNMFIEKEWCIFLCNENEFDSLIKALDPSKIKLQLNAKDERDSLFQ